MTNIQTVAVGQVALEMFATSKYIFWISLPAVFLLAMLVLYVKGEINGGAIESLLRRTIIAIALLVAFPQISSVLTQVESGLSNAFGGEETIKAVFGKVAEHADEVKSQGSFSWIKVGQMGLTIISTVSFLILSLIQHFLYVLRLVLWNLLHIIGPIALLGVLHPNWANTARGVFVGLFELALWKPLWIIMAKILIAVGFGEPPKDPSQWFDTVVMNFTVAGLMASTPILVHAIFSGSLASVGGGAIQTMLSGAGSILTSAPMRAIQAPINSVKQHARQIVRGSPQRKPVNGKNFKK